jgi:hypothetical protein
LDSAYDSLLDAIDDAIEPERMTASEALDLLDLLIMQLQARADSLRSANPAT